MLPECFLQRSLDSLAIIREAAFTISSLFVSLRMDIMDFAAFPEDLPCTIALHIFFSCAFLTSSLRVPLGYAMEI